MDRLNGDGRDLRVAELFFRAHSAAELGQPLTRFRLAHQRPAQLDPDERAAVALVIDDRGQIAGVVGATATGDGVGGPEGASTWADVMVPIGSITLVDGEASAVALLPGLARDGLVLIRLRRGLASARTADVKRRLRAWTARTVSVRRMGSALTGSTTSARVP